MESTRLWTNFQLETTADESPTLRLNGTDPLNPLKSAESMHHSGGAASETLYIYGEAITWVMNHYSGKNPLRVCSVGLGLGYNEILVGLLSFQKQIPLHLESYEIDSELIQTFAAWVSTPPGAAQLPQFRIYDQIFTILCAQLSFNISLTDFKYFLHNLIEKKHWRLKTELSVQTIPVDSTFHLCLFDAFSQKTSGELWSEPFLNLFFEKCFDRHFCLLATYACTGLLTRTLKQNGFRVTKKIGFKNKRDSTWAERIL